MKTNQLIYASRTKKKLEFQDVRTMAKQFAIKNRSLCITGLLIYGNNFFMQILEGHQEDINNLYLKIAQDKRHGDLRLLNYSKIVQRQFDQWNMGCLLLETQPEVKLIVDNYFENEKFEPFNLTPDQANLFMNEIGQFYLKN